MTAHGGVGAPVDGEAKPGVAVLSLHSDIVEPEEQQDRRSLEEMIFEGASEALRKARLSISDIDSVVLSGYDQSDGRIISCMVSAGPAGGVGRDVTMIASSGEHALIYAYLRLVAAQARKVLVVGWGKPSESVSPERAELVAAEPFLLRNVGMNNTIAAGMQASRLGCRAATEDLVCWPLGRADLPPRADVVHALVMAVDGAFAPGSELCWVAGAGWVTGAYELGGRDLADFGLVTTAVEQMVRQGGPRVDQWTSVEIAAPSEPAVVETAKVLGLATSTRVNSHGPISAVPTTPHVAGMGRMIAAAEAARRWRGYSAGIGMHGFAAQGVSVVTFFAGAKAAGS